MLLLLVGQQEGNSVCKNSLQLPTEGIRSKNRQEAGNQNGNQLTAVSWEQPATS